MPESHWREVIEHVNQTLEDVHAGPHLGIPLREIVRMKQTASNPYACEVSVQRAAARLEDKSLIERCYVKATCASERIRSFVCVRIKPTEEELAETARLRAEAKRIHLRHTIAAVTWIKKHGQTIQATGRHQGTVVGYHRAAVDWVSAEELNRDDGKWLVWFQNL